MRHVLLLLLGVVIGTLAAISMSNAISQRNPVPRAVMVMMAYHQGQLNRALRSGQCSSAGMTTELQLMDASAVSIPAVFQGFDQGFGQAAVRLRQKIAQAAATQSSVCQAWQAPLAGVKEACEACHRQYR